MQREIKWVLLAFDEHAYLTSLDEGRNFQHAPIDAYLAWSFSVSAPSQPRKSSVDQVVQELSPSSYASSLWPIELKRGSADWTEYRITGHVCRNGFRYADQLPISLALEWRSNRPMLLSEQLRGQEALTLKMLCWHQRHLSKKESFPQNMRECQNRQAEDWLEMLILSRWYENTDTGTYRLLQAVLV